MSSHHEPSPLKAVLWDMDGTLVDTEPYWIAAEYALVDSYGGTWTEADAHALVGNALLDSADYIRERGGVPLDSPAIVERLITEVIASARRFVPWRPGAQELLAAVRAAGIPCALVTMSYTSLADAVISQLPPGTFDAVITGDVVRRGKPHPEPYLTAAAALGVAPGDAVAIEDSPTGVASAEAAGCRVLAVPHTVHVGPGPRRTLARSLADIDLARLEALVTPAA